MTEQWIRKITLILSIIFIFCIAMPVTAAVPAPQKLSLDELFEFRQEMKIADYEDEDLEKIFNKNLDMKQTLYGNPDQIEDEVYRQFENQVFKQNYNPKKAITYEEAMEDVDQFCDLWKRAGRDYERIGGDQAFKDFRERVAKELKEISAERPLLAEDLELAMADNVFFIDNNHFWLGGSYNSAYVNQIRFDKTYGYDTNKDPRWANYAQHFLGNNLTFQKIKDDYLCYENDLKVDLKELEKQEIDLVPSWNANFELIYRLHCYHQTAEGRPEAIQFEGGKQEPVEWVLSEMVPWYYDSPFEPMKLHDINGVAYINLYGDVFSDDSWEGNQDYIDIGLGLKDYDCAIIDLRDNNGGFPRAIQTLIAHYVGVSVQSVQPSCHSVYATTPKELKFLKKTARQSKNAFYGDNYVINLGNKKVHKVPGLIIVLTNRNTASQGENSVDLLRHLSNVVVVGDATFGTLVSSSGDFYNLKHSQVPFSIPIMIFLWHPDVFQENIGMQPDIWLMSDNVNLYALANYMRSLVDPD